MIEQTSNPIMDVYYPRHYQLAYGGSCPGSTLVYCIGDLGTLTMHWGNNFDTIKRVYFMIDAYSDDHGNFTIAWTVQVSLGNKLQD